MIRRVHDRIAFGAVPGQLEAAAARGLSATVKGLLAMSGTDAGAAKVPAPSFGAIPRKGKNPSAEDKKARTRVLRTQRAQLLGWWLQRAVAADHQGSERMTWFWHGHFATSIAKVRVPQLMYTQHVTQQRLALGSFTTLANAMIVDPAMLVWLDGRDNVKGAPNENLSREFMELFSLGHGNYGETDVREAARALTGWTIDRDTLTARLDPDRHDASAKTILGHTANFDANSFVGLVLSQPASPAFVIGRLWFRLVSSTPPDHDTLAALEHVYGPGRDIAAVITAITATPAFAAADASLVKSPVEWLVGLCRAVGVRELPDRKGAGTLLKGLTAMGQVPFAPPSVGGWPAGRSWLTTATVNARIELAAAVAAAADGRLVEGNSRSSRIEAVRRVLGVDAWTSRTADALSGVADSPADLLTAAACSPEYSVSR